MKTYSKKSVSKLVARFDSELRNLLMDDLKAIKSVKDQLMKTLDTGLNQDSLTAA
jgi:hypothetical protein